MKVFTYKTQVYFKDTDAGGILYHGNYIPICEVARTHWQNGIIPKYSATNMMKDGLVYVVCEVDIKYKRPAKLDDELDILCTVLELGAAFATFRQEFKRGEETLTIAKIKVAIVHKDTGRPVRFPAELKKAYEEYMYEGEDK